MHIKKTLTFLTFLLFSCSPLYLFASSKTTATQLPTLFLYQGEQRLLKMNNIKRFSLGGTAARAIRNPNAPSHSLLLKGVEKGVSDLWIWKTDQKVEHRTVKVEPAS